MLRFRLRLSPTLPFVFGALAFVAIADLTESQAPGAGTANTVHHADVTTTA